MDRGAWWATYSPWGHKESDMTERLYFFTNQSFTTYELWRHEQTASSLWTSVLP